MVLNSFFNKNDEMRIKIIFTSVFFFHIIFLESQTQLKDSVLLDDVVVTGTKTEIKRKLIPLSVSQINTTAIEQTGYLNVMQTLNSFAPGVFITERSLLGFGVAAGGSGSISMRGISSAPNTSVLVLIDGHPQYQGVFGHPLPDAYVASDVKTVEIIRGPASILYGSNAMAGVINLITKTQEKKGINANIGASYGQFNTQKYYGNIGAKGAKLSASFSVNYDKTDGLRENTDFEITNAYTKLAYNFNSNWNITSDFSLAQYSANDNGPVTLEVPKPFSIDILRGKAAVSLENKFKQFDGAIKIYHNFGEHTLSDGFHSLDNNSGVMLYETFRIKDKTVITLGIDVKKYGGIVSQPSFQQAVDKTINEQAIYTYIQQNLFDKLMLSGGVRFENNSVFGNAMVPMTGLSYNVFPHSTIKASLSGGFRSPTMMELYLYAPNPDLKPERMMNYEVSWLQSALGNKLNAEFTAFLVSGADMIQVAGIPPAMKRQNIGSFENKGVEVAAGYLLNKDFRVSMNYSYVDFKVNVLAAPRSQFNFVANYQSGIFNFNVSSQYVDLLYTQVATQTLDAVTQSYFLLNARIAARPVNKLELYLMANNILNQSYEINYGYPMPKAYFNAGFNFSI